MPEIKHVFNQGKMNKDLDERLVENGQYRDAMNIQVSTSEGSDVGTVQNLLGNINLFANNQLPPNSRCVGAIADESNNRFYWFVQSSEKNLILAYEGGQIYFIFVDTKNVLKFPTHKLITGINVIDTFLLWTDDYSEPKKINFENCFTGTKQNGFYHTKLVVPKRGITINDCIDIREEHITVIKKSPKTKLTLEPEYERIITATTSFDFGQGTSDLMEVGETGQAYFNNFQPTNNFYQVGDFVLFNNSDLSLDPGSYQVRIEITEILMLSDGLYEFEIITIADSTSTALITYDCITETSKELFERKFARFGYRYKFQDNEYSSFSPFTDPLFKPSSFEYDSKEAYNKAMENTIVSLKIRNFLTKETPEDVVQIDLLYKESNSPTVYIVDKIKFFGTESVRVAEQNLNYWNANLYELTSDLIYSVVSSNQLLRPWDNVPRKALAQEISGNRLIYANYLQNYNLNNKPNLHATYTLRYPQDETYSNHYSLNRTNAPSPVSSAIFADDLIGQKSLKSLRNYQLGVTYLDEYNRETPIFTGVNAIFNTPKISASTPTKIKTQVKSQPPSWAKSFKVYVKETSTEYYNLCMNRSYRADDGNVWISFPSSERNKIDEDSYLILKKGIDTNRLVEEKAKYKVLAIENEAPEYIATEKIELTRKSCDGEISDTASNAHAIFGDVSYSPTVNSKSFRIIANSWDGTGNQKLHEITDTLYISFRNNTLNEQTSRYEIISVEFENSSSHYKITLKSVFRTHDADLVYENYPTNNEISASVKMIVHKQKVIINSAQFKGMFFVKINSDAIIEEKVLTTLGEDDYQVVSTMPCHYFEDTKADPRHTAQNTKSDPNIGHAYGGRNLGNYTSPSNPNTNSISGSLSNKKEKWIDLLDFGGSGNGLFPSNHEFAFTENDTIGGFFIDKVWFADVQPGGGARHDDIQSNGHCMRVVGNSSVILGDAPQEYIFPFNNNVAWNKFISYRDIDGNANTTGTRTANYGKGVYTEDNKHYVEISYSSIGIDEFRNGDYIDTSSVNQLMWGSFNNTGIFEPLVNSAAMSNYAKNYSATNDELRTVINNLSKGKKFKIRGDDNPKNIYTILRVKKIKRYNYKTPVEVWSNYAYWEQNSGDYGDEPGWNQFVAGWDNFGYPENRRMTYRLELSHSLTDVKIDEEELVHDDNIGTQKSVSFQFVEPTYIHDENQPISENPAIWETEPKESADLDIYYQASDLIPVSINEKTNTSFIPLGSVVTCSARPATIISRTHVIAWEDNKVTFNRDIDLVAYQGNGGIVKLIFTRPDDSYTMASINTAATLADTDLALNTYIVHPSVATNPVGLSWFNCYSFGNGVESNRIRDDFNQPTISKGVSVSTVLEENYEEERRSSGLIYSGIYNSDNAQNNLNQFIQAEKITKDLNPSYSSIQKLYSRSTADGDLIAICEDRVLKILANKDALFNADGNVNITSTNNVLGQAIPYAGEYGIAKNPESFANDSYRIYFTDKQRGAVLRLSRDGLTPISEYGMSDYFKDNLSFANEIIGSFDDRKGEYNITLPHVEKTVSFKEGINGWSSFKSFVPEQALSMGNDYYTVKNSLPYQHHVEQFDSSGKEINRNTFYGIYEPSSIDVLLNDSPSSVKSYKTLSYEGSQSNVDLEVSRVESGYYNLHNKDGWHVSSIDTDKQSGVVPEFIEKEGKWFNFIKGKKINEVLDSTTKEFSFQGVGRPSEFSIDDRKYLAIQGCTDPRASNYNSDATIDDGSCFLAPPETNDSIGGCMDANAINHNPLATYDDGSCIGFCEVIPGCTNPLAFNYDSNATVDDGTCELPVYGCTDPRASNYDPLANTDDGSCYLADPDDPNDPGASSFSLTIQDTNDPDTNVIPPPNN